MNFIFQIAFLQTVSKAVESQFNCSNVEERADSVKKKYLSYLTILREKPLYTFHFMSLILFRNSYCARIWILAKSKN